MNAVIEHQSQDMPTPTASLAPITPTTLLQTAVERGASMEMLERLIALQERVEANDARKAYVTAMTAFKARPPTIVKNKHVSFDTQKGKTEYNHPTLDHVSSVIGEEMGKHGLSHRWEVQQADGGAIRVTCHITHVLGHVESVSLSGPPDQSGGKNNIQAVGSTVTYLQRYTLLAAAGMAAGEEDDDGAGAEKPEPTITEEQHSNLLDQIAAITATSEAAALYTKRLCNFLKVDSLETTPASKYANAVAQIDVRKKKIAESHGDSR